MTSESPDSPAPAGWYPDPESTGQYRWWDGSAWGVTATPPGPMPPPGGGASLESAGSWLAESFRQALRQFGLALPLFVLLVIPAQMLAAVAFWNAFGQATLHFDPAANQMSTEGIHRGASYVYLLLQVVSALLGWWFYAAATHQSELLATAADSASANPANPANPDGGLHPASSWGPALKQGLASMPAVLPAFLGRGVLLAGVTILIVLAATVLGLVGGVGGAALSTLLLLVVLPLALVWLWLRLALVGTAAIVGRSDLPAWKRGIVESWQRSHRNLGALFTRYLLVVLVSIGLFFFVSTLGALFGSVASEPTTVPQVGEPFTVNFGDVLPASLPFYAIGRLFAGLGIGARTLLIALATLRLFRDLNGELEPASPNPPGSAT